MDERYNAFIERVAESERKKRPEDRSTALALDIRLQRLWNRRRMDEDSSDLRKELAWRRSFRIL